MQTSSVACVQKSAVNIRRQAASVFSWNLWIIQICGSLFTRDIEKKTKAKSLKNIKNVFLFSDYYS